MDKIYGYKKDELLFFIDEIKKNDKNLSALFSSVAKKLNKSKGTIRNMYYSIVQKSKTDDEFCEKYFYGKALQTKNITPFNKQEEDWLLGEIERAKKNGKSVRKTVLTLSNGDARIALRLQNKYRNMVKDTEKSDVKPTDIEVIKDKVSPEKYKKLCLAINNLVNEISLPEKRENQLLRSKLCALELENIRLKSIIGQNSTKRSALDFFIGDRDVSK